MLWMWLSEQINWDEILAAHALNTLHEEVRISSDIFFPIHTFNSFWWAWKHSSPNLRHFYLPTVFISVGVPWFFIGFSVCLMFFSLIFMHSVNVKDVIIWHQVFSFKVYYHLLSHSLNNDSLIKEINNDIMTSQAHVWVQWQQQHAKWKCTN